MNGRPPSSPESDDAIRVVLASRDRVFSASLARRLRRAGLNVIEGSPDSECVGSAEVLARCDVLVIETEEASSGDRDLVQEILTQSPLVEVIAVSAKTAVPEAVHAFRSGLFAVLEHPVDAELLLATVIEASRRKHRAEERIQELDRMAGRMAGAHERPKKE